MVSVCQKVHKSTYLKNPAGYESNGWRQCKYWLDLYQLSRLIDNFPPLFHHFSTIFPPCFMGKIHLFPPGFFPGEIPPSLVGPGAARTKVALGPSALLGLGTQSSWWGYLYLSIYICNLSIHRSIYIHTYIISYHIISYYIILYYIILNYIILYYTIRYYIISNYIILYYIILYFIILYFSI